ncbi:MAG: sigma 54-interacting transcriptional regulator [Bacillota bacterium]
MIQNSLFSKYEIVGKNINDYMKNLGHVLELDSTVLLTGETGTGKELVARWVQQSIEQQKLALL